MKAKLISVNRTNKVLLLVAGYCISLLTASGAGAQQTNIAPGTNIALGKTATFSEAPNYPACTDPGDAKQITDGLYSRQKGQFIWQQKSTVGWDCRAKDSIVITIDLGSVQPISGVSYSTGAGSDADWPGGVSWPTAIRIAVSDDGKIWHDTGNLLRLSRRNGPLPSGGHWGGYRTFQYTTHDLTTKGRYISLGVVATPFIFVDEIEVYKGDDAWLNQPASGDLIPDLNKDFLSPAVRIASSVQVRLSDDSAAISQAVQESALPADRKMAFEERLKKDAAGPAPMGPLPLDFKTVLPLNDAHRDILAVHGELLAAQGFKPLTVWKQQRYAWLPLLAQPSAQTAAQLHISMLRNQFRSDDLLLTNASGQPESVALQFQNEPAGAANDWLQVYSAEWTDTVQCVPVADALLPVTPQAGVYTVEIPAGMTRKVWFTVDSSKLPAGSYIGTCAVNGGGQQISVPCDLEVSSVKMGTPRASLETWDYTNGDGYEGLTPRNRQAAIALMRSHFLDTRWATFNALPWPVAGDFDAAGNLKNALGFSEMDQWIGMWPGARHYFASGKQRERFAGAKMGTPEFNARVGAWAKALAAHMKELGLQPKQLGLLVWDEPATDSEFAYIGAWSKAIRAGAPELTLVEDPTYVSPDRTNARDAVAQADIVFPDLANTYKVGSKEEREYFESLRAQGRELWFYQCAGNVRLFDPQLYYRYAFWQGYAVGANGEGFWSFSDIRGVPTFRNEYSQAGGYNYAPACLDTDTVYDSLHWDAVREGVEDYEELAMLNDAIEASRDLAWKARAMNLLNDSVKAVTGVWSANYSWKNEIDPNLADAQLKKVRDMLEKRTGA